MKFVEAVEFVNLRPVDADGVQHVVRFEAQRSLLESLDFAHQVVAIQQDNAIVLPLGVEARRSEHEEEEKDRRAGP